ncbi:LLM class F420-dependent oxidoreductase [Mycobacterium sp.]|uniref:LLM class F420-dependent oxidoreductase n=1 Tax=Mycobacterium sp. TaxID=1785 RepID=UPI0025DC652F|nr:LLM class F420-dependent oxidoreductase [Mycobacterium sp.]
MELGIHFIDFLPGNTAALAPTLLSTAAAAEDIGASIFTLADHFFQMEAVGKAEDPFLEGYTSLGYLAGQTTTIQLALLVTGVTYRHPGLLAKTVTTLDVLSQGRSMFGIGAAWYEREHLALGVPYPSLSTRFEMLEETLQICRQMWSDNDGPYQGEHYQLAETICQPQPIRRPPILIGGGGEKKTLRLVAQYADVWNSTDSEIDVLAHKIDVLTRHCENVGRDVTEIRKTVGFFDDPFSDVDGYLRRVERMAGLGVDMINTGPVPGSPDPAGFVKRFGDEVMPRLVEVG